MSDDLYEVMGVSRDAGQDEIKQRYRKLAKELHPDLNPDKPDVAAQFSQVIAAYDILPERRVLAFELDQSGRNILLVVQIFEAGWHLDAGLANDLAAAAFRAVLD